MAGAPQGPVYQVVVLETREFEPSPNPEEEMQVRISVHFLNVSLVLSMTPP